MEQWGFFSVLLGKVAAFGKMVRKTVWDSQGGGAGQGIMAGGIIAKGVLGFAQVRRGKANGLKSEIGKPRFTLKKGSELKGGGWRSGSVVGNVKQDARNGLMLAMQLTQEENKKTFWGPGCIFQVPWSTRLWWAMGEGMSVL